MSVLLTFFVDNLGWSIVFPIFAPFFLDPSNVLFSADVSLTARTTILGCFLAVFPLAQFFGAPLLGEFADNNGRKKAFLFSIFLTFVGYLLSAWGMKRHNLIFLFLGRMISGFFSGNTAICLASLSDLSLNEKIKIKNFGLLSIFGGFSFIVGVFLGGRLSDSTVNDLFSPDIPLWVAAGLALINFIFIAVSFKETLLITKKIKLDPLEGVHSLQNILKNSKIKFAYLIYFLFSFGLAMLFQFIPVLVVQKFNFTNSRIGMMASFMGISWALGSVLINRFLKRFNRTRILEASLLLFTALSFSILLAGEEFFLWSILGAIFFICGIIWPLCNAIISGFAPVPIQGKILGISLSMQSLAMATSPILGGLFFELYSYLPFLLAALSSLAAAIIYFNIKKT